MMVGSATVSPASPREGCKLFRKHLTEMDTAHGGLATHRAASRLSNESTSSHAATYEGLGRGTDVALEVCLHLVQVSGFRNDILQAVGLIYAQCDVE